MSKKIIYTEGQKVGNMTFVGNDHTVNVNNRSRRLADFKCKCGKIKEARVDFVLAGRISTCGCVTPNLKHGNAVHGKESDEYNIWSGIRTRCYNPNDHAYPDYGGRGIKMCDAWYNSFEAFLADVGKRPSKKHSIDRYPNNDGNYVPTNFRWATAKEQSDTRRGAIIVTFNGETLPLRLWAEKTGIHRYTIWERLHKSKWSVERALTEPVKKTA